MTDDVDNINITARNTQTTERTTANTFATGKYTPPQKTETRRTSSDALPSEAESEEGDSDEKDDEANELKPPPSRGKKMGSAFGTAGSNQMRFMELMQHNKVDTAAASRVLTMEEVARHNKPSDCWVVYRGVVYDITQYLKYHPGGSKILLTVAGKDCTSAFMKHHRWVNCAAILKGTQVGVIASAATQQWSSANQLTPF